MLQNFVWKHQLEQLSVIKSSAYYRKIQSGLQVACDEREGCVFLSRYQLDYIDLQQK